MAAAARWPILLVPATGAPPSRDVRSAITSLGIRTALVAGGCGAVSSATVDALPLSAPPGQRWARVAGTDRMDTSRKMADWALQLTGS